MIRTTFGITSLLCIVSINSNYIQAQTVDVALDIYYSNPADTNSDGTWQLVAKSSHRGLAGLDIAITGLNPGPIFQAPWGLAEEGFKQSFNGGLTPFDVDQDGDAATLDMIFAQIPVESPGPQDLFYDVGVPGGATQPGENGTPLVPGLLPGGNIPWNFSDTLGDMLDDATLNNSGAFEGGVLMASGTFDANSTFNIITSGTISGANVFTALGTSINPPAVGTIVGASLSAQIRDNTYLAIPEPSALVLAAMAGALVGCCQRRRRS